MLTFAQVNFGLNIAGLIGIIYLLWAIIYLILTVAWLSQRGTSLRGWALALYLIQLIFTPIIMLLSGVILYYQGWRLDPVLQFEQFLLLLLILYLSIKDIVINAVYRDR
ncbi:MAG: Ycf66 family protein [Nostoc sp. EfeVER01]|uniref:Ycf66 family protein n=1 Tax=unclassified Nostoc TaxID=2593658 RepID=UPI002AD4209D|nr:MULTISPECIES: Ycf66 family protein [unclassified Nostoc]MDZ7948745.1 Ycf66 family protein [Nostoc sp. EfeVER01]MDZ7991221.1 Ycf66 family protein [Nostoc sp. EspVER01]